MGTKDRRQMFFLLTTLATMTTLFAIDQQPASKFTSQNNSNFAQTIADKKTQLVDVRTVGEYVTGYIPDAVNIDVQSASFDTNASELDKSRPVALRSKTAAKKFADKGFKVYELDRGISGWNGEISK